MKQLAIVFAITALAIPSFAQQGAQQPAQPPFQERIDVNLVLLDVIVTDAKGNQILGLTKDDFIVKEDGTEQPVESLDFFTNRRLLDAREENAPFPVERVREERYFIFFFDKPEEVGALFDQLTLAREAVRKFVRNDMKENDRVAIVGHDVRLKVFSDFTNNKAELEKAISASAKFGRGLERPSGDNGILQVIDRDEMMKNTGRVYDAVRLLAESTRPIRARKNLVLFSPGIVEQGETIRDGMITNRSRRFDEMLEALNDANVAVYPVQLQRDIDTTPMFHQRLEETAASTGGHYFRFNTSFYPAVDKVENVNNGYYLISYRTKRGAGESGFQKVDVKLRNPEFRVKAREGYAFGG